MRAASPRGRRPCFTTRRRLLKVSGLDSTLFWLRLVQLAARDPAARARRAGDRLRADPGLRAGPEGEFLLPAAGGRRLAGDAGRARFITPQVRRRPAPAAGRARRCSRSPTSGRCSRSPTPASAPGCPSPSACRVAERWRRCAAPASAGSSTRWPRGRCCSGGATLAMTWYRRMLALDPDDTLALASLGFQHAQAGREARGAGAVRPRARAAARRRRGALQPRVPAAGAERPRRRDRRVRRRRSRSTPTTTARTTASRCR